MNDSTRLAIDLGTDPAQLADVFARLEAYAETNGWPMDVAMQVQLILEEVLLNCMTHGLGGRADGLVRLTIAQQADQVDIEIVDNGIAFDPLAHPEPDLNASIEEREIGGLGIHFMRTIMDEVSYRRADGLNLLKMVKRMPRDGSGSHPQQTGSQG